eukprot:jgi/Tetstr1/454321/TSEL_041240.t1
MPTGEEPVVEPTLESLQSAGVNVDVVVNAGAAAKDAFASNKLGQRTLDLLSSSLTAQTLKSYAGRLSQFAEFCHDSENISPLEVTTATVVRSVGTARWCCASAIAGRGSTVGGGLPGGGGLLTYLTVQVYV